MLLNYDEQLRCPECNQAGKMIFHPDPGDIRLARCEGCNYKLPVYGGIPDFAEHIALTDPKLNPAQKLMNSRLFAFLYESFLWRPLHTRIGSGISTEQEVQEVLEMSRTGCAHRVADLACGTGHYARAFAQKVPEGLVYGLDVSLSMLVRGHKIARRKGLTNIIFLRGDIHLLPFDDESIDRVNCGGALHLFGDLRPIWKEVSRILKPKGVFTGMTLTLADGAIRKGQQWLVNRGRATFFHPDQLASDLVAVGLSTFKYLKHRVSLLFCAVKD